ncbi:helix-turn-helix transcriptional regulator [Pseudonocardia sp. N23]|uniref:helix-turn-helix transcriptional regulator n=1 Tax=Pseudonocardia sp. N23 TaxID=1987376 RepID=UPI000BFE9FEA|nr:BREX system ATP-binding domain-containing protein [Pseudonocardia sp. N23]
MSDVPRLGVGIPLVGRRDELRALSAALDAAAAGTAGAVLLAGEAGVGKTRLVAETVGRAHAAGFAVLTGRCLDTGEATLPYLPFTEALRVLATDRPDLVDAHPPLHRLLPGSRPREEVSAGERDLGQLRVFDAVLSVLEQRSAQDPVLLVLEDVHWADTSSRDLLVFLASRLGAQRLLVMASYRGDDLHRRHPLRPLLAELVRLPAVARVELGALGVADAEELVRELADGALTDQEIARIARRSEGNAFFAEELVSASDEGVPDGLAEVLLARLDRVTPEARRVLRAASVAGRRVRHDRLAAVLDLGVDELETALRSTVAHHILVPEPGGRSVTASDTYVFRHALLHEAVYQDLLPGERSRLHAAFAALLSPGGDRDEPGAVAELAHHALAAHDLPLALSASVRAADEADRRGGPAEVLLHAERALSLWAAVPDAHEVTGATEITITRWAAWAAAATGDPDRGVALARRSVELADREHDPLQAADLRVRYALRMLELGEGEEPRRVVGEALELYADAPPSGDLAWAHAVAARSAMRLDDIADAGSRAYVALQVACEVVERGLDGHDDAVAAQADALVTLSVCEEALGRDEAARGRLAEAKELARTSGNLGVELRTFFNTGISLLDAGRLGEAAAEFAAGEERAVATGTTWSSYGLELRVAHVLAAHMRGDWDDAEASARMGVAAVSETVATRVAAAALLTEVGRGRFDAAERRLSGLSATRPTDDQVLLLLGQAGAESALWRGEPRRALERIASAREGLLAWDPHHLAGIMLCAIGVAAFADLAAGGTMDRGEAVTGACELAAAGREAAAKGTPRGAQLGVEGLAWLARIEAELARARGDVEAPQRWADVVEAFGYGDRYRQALARRRRAEALLLGAPPDTGAVVGGGGGSGGGSGGGGEPVRRAEAADELRRALATATELGAAPLAAAVRDLADRAGVALAATDGSAPVRDVLTPRERSVLELVAGGRTNRQVGAELFISEKTVSVHLSRVMAKLGAASRTEAVSLAWSRGLLGP